MKLEKQFIEIRQLINKAKLKAFKSINTELIDLYWQIGKYISNKITTQEWGKGIVKNLSEYLNKKEPDMKGFSSPNLWRMKQFYEVYHTNTKLSPLVREISWTNSMVIQCLVAIDLKITDFKPEYLGKMEFYLEALDRDVRKEHENPSVGLILCKNKDSKIVEYALSRSVSPMLISQYETKLIDKKLLETKLDEFFEIGGNK